MFKSRIASFIAAACLLVGAAWLAPAGDAGAMTGQISYDGCLDQGGSSCDAVTGGSRSAIRAGEDVDEMTRKSQQGGRQ